MEPTWTLARMCPTRNLTVSVRALKWGSSPADQKPARHPDLSNLRTVRRPLCEYSEVFVALTIPVGPLSTSRITAS